MPGAVRHQAQKIKWFVGLINFYFAYYETRISMEILEKKFFQK